MKKSSAMVSSTWSLSRVATLGVFAAMLLLGGCKKSTTTTTCSCDVTSNGESAHLTCSQSACVSGTTYTCDATGNIVMGTDCTATADAGTSDDAGTDAGVTTSDAGVDSGTEVDLGTPDLGTDSGTPDLGTDSGTDSGTPSMKRVFVTTATLEGDFYAGHATSSPITQANSQCQTEADANSLGSTWVALLNYNGGSIQSALGNLALSPTDTVRYSLNGDTILSVDSSTNWWRASSFSGLTHADGSALGSLCWWIGADPSDGIDGMDRCGGSWDETTGTLGDSRGDVICTNATSDQISLWPDYGQEYDLCAMSRPIFCFEQ